MEPARAVIVICVGLDSAPVGTTTETPASGMLRYPPSHPIVFVTVIGAARGVLRWRPWTVSPSVLVTVPSRPPSRSLDGPAAGALSVAGAVTRSDEQLATASI